MVITIDLCGTIDTKNINGTDIEHKYLLDDSDLNNSLVSIYFLDKIIEFCKGNEIETIFLIMPEYIDDKDYRYRFIIDTYYPEISTIDFSTENLPDSCYADIIHLNKYGAAILSSKISSKLLE